MVYSFHYCTYGNPVYVHPSSNLHAQRQHALKTSEIRFCDIYLRQSLLMQLGMHEYIIFSFLRTSIVRLPRYHTLFRHWIEN